MHPRRIFVLLAAAAMLIAGPLPNSASRPASTAETGSPLSLSLGPEPAYAQAKPRKKKKVKRRKRAKKEDEKSAKEESAESDDFSAVSVVGKDDFSPQAFEQENLGASGLDAVLVLDSSRSMQRTDPTRLRDQAAKLFLRFLSEGDRISIIQFDQDTKILLPLTPVDQDILLQMDSAIESIPLEGNFTDLWSPLVAAYELLMQEGRKNAQQVVILLSDGKMDPHPNVGTAEELTERLFATDLKSYREHDIKIYTLAMSEEADRKLLADISRAADGLHWYAPDVNTVHKILSDLFLTLKKPQVVALEGSGFEVDGTTQEATFYISRKEPDKMVIITDPRGKEFSNVDFPPGVKWYRGALFDVITVANPIPGRWGVRGIEEPEGFATLLTDLKLQIRWPEYNVRIGDTIAFMARLTEGDKPVTTPAMKEVTFYTFKVINSQTGQLLFQGSMNDKGLDGDVESGDDIYSSSIKIDEEGDYKALIAVAGPTFSRQQHVSFNVSTGLIRIELVPANEFTGEPEMLQVFVNSSALKLKGLNVFLVGRRPGEEKSVGRSLKNFHTENGLYKVPQGLLETGEWEVYAALRGNDPKTKKKVEAASETIKYVSTGLEGEEEDAEGDLEFKEFEEPDPGSGVVLFGSISTGTSLLFVGLIGFLFYKKSGQEGGVAVEQREAYVVPEELLERVNAATARSSETKRPLLPPELKIFALISDELGVSTPEVPADAETETDTDADADADAGGEAPEEAPPEEASESADEGGDDEEAAPE